MKKLLKSNVCGSREQCMDTLFTRKKSKVPSLKKKKSQKRKHASRKRKMRFPNALLFDFVLSGATYMARVPVNLVYLSC